MGKNHSGGGDILTIRIDPREKEQKTRGLFPEMATQAYTGRKEEEPALKRMSATLRGAWRGKRNRLGPTRSVG